jgi:micrococcal nuclease
MNSKQKSIYHFFLVLSLLVGSFTLLSAQQKTGLLSVSKVVDGDTFWLINARGEEEKIRLIGVDSPEARNAGRVKKEYFGAESSAFAKRMLDGKRVRLEYDVQRKDRYQRTLAYVYLEDGTFFNALLVREGYATVATFPPNVEYEKLFIRLQREARSQRKGLWK